MHASDSISAIIRASAVKCYSIMKDYSYYPQWQKVIISTEKLRDGNEGPIVEVRADLGIRKIRYVVEYIYDDANTSFSWRYIEGDVKSVSGGMQFHERGNVTEVVYEMNIDLGFWLPSGIMKTLKKVAMAGVLEDLKKQVE